MRRLPVYFLIDVSESMIGEPIENVQKGMRSIIQELRTDPYALETAFASVIAFAGRAIELSPLTELYKFYPPVLPIGGGTAVGNALDFLMNHIDANVKKTTLEEKGDWKPIVFMFTDGTPTDDPTEAFSRWNNYYRKHASLVVISLGDNVDTSLFGQITENVIRFNPSDEMSYKVFFKWVSDSIKASSISVSEINTDELKLAPVDGKNLEKVDTTKTMHVDENYAVILGKCASTKRPYLVKFAKRGSEIEGLSGFSPIDFKLVGAYPVDEEKYKSLTDSSVQSRRINVGELIGNPTCPCCGNQYALVVCGCGNVFCVGDDMKASCPWCGTTGTMEFTTENFDLNRTNG